MFVPSILVFLITIVYGLSMNFGRPSKYNYLESSFQNDPEATRLSEIERLKKDERIFKVLTKVWLGLILLGIVGLIFLPGNYYKGIGLGVLLLGVAAFSVDYFMHKRLDIYLNQLQS